MQRCGYGLTGLSSARCAGFKHSPFGAVNTGHLGSMTTIYADSPQHTID